MTSAHFWFNTAMVFAMTMKLTTYFAVIAALPELASVFAVSKGVIAQTGTVYEAGKFAGALLFGVLSGRRNMLSLTLLGMTVYCVLVVGGWGVLEVLPEASLGNPPLPIVLFLVFFFAVSAVCIVSQFGLTLLRFVNDEHTYRQVLMAQAIVANIMHAIFILVGAAAVAALGWRAPFAFLFLWGAIITFAMWLSARDDHYEAVGKRQQLRADSDQFASYFRRVGRLLRRPNYVTYVFALGTSTANLYAYPTIGILLLTAKDGLALPNLEATLWIAASFVVSATSRATTLCLLSKRPALFVHVGVAAMAVGGGLFVGLAFLAPYTKWQIVAPGLVIMFGVGIAAPHCKAGALLSVPDELSTTATSVLKIIQLLVTVVAQLLLGLLYNGSTKPFALTLGVLNVGMLLLLLVGDGLRLREPTGEREPLLPRVEDAAEEEWADVPSPQAAQVV